MDANDGISSFDNDANASVSHALPVALTGYKTARVKMNNGQIMLSALTVTTPIPFDADAHCDIWSDAHQHYQTMLDSSPEYVADVIPPLPSDPPHEVPSELCTCGFYAYAEPDNAINHDQNDDSCVLVEVAISGKYLSYESGYRYAHQRVKKVHVGACMVCSAPPVGMTVLDQGWMRPVCAEHKTADSFSFDQMSMLVADQIKAGYAPVEFLAGSSAPQVPADLVTESDQVNSDEIANTGSAMRYTLVPLVACVSIACTSVVSIILVLTG